MPAAASLLVFSKRGIIFQNGLFFARGGGGAACSEDPLIGHSSKGTFQYLGNQKFAVITIYKISRKSSFEM